MINPPLVSVIIPNYNNAKWLPKCIESCIEQGEFLKEIIIVDDHSTDNSLGVLSEYQSRHPIFIKVFTNPKKGANHARNYGFEQSCGEYIQWLDSDDWLITGKFQNQIEALKKSNADIAYADFRIDHFKDGKLAKSELKKFESSTDYLLELIKDTWNVTHSYLLRRSFAEKLNNGVGWNPNTKVGQDREYFTMAGILGARFQYVPGIFAVYNKQQSGTISGMDFKKRLRLNQILESRFRDEIANNSSITNFTKKALNSILDTHKAKACYYYNKITFDKLISPFNLEWSIIHWKMRLVIPFIVFIKNIQLIFKL